MIIAVTGATGHIGSNLVRALISKGQKVRALTFNGSHGIENLGIEFVKGDVRDADSLSRAFAGVDIVYHLAAITSSSSNDWPMLESTNVLGTRNVVETCLKCEVRRLVHFSSIHAIEQGPADSVINEFSPLADSQDCPPYERSKAGGEREVRKGIELGLNAVILNPTAVIGPQDYQPSLFGEVLLAMAQSKLPVLVEGGFNWVDARDVVQAALRAEEVAPVGAKYLLSGQWATLRDLAKIVEDITGTPAPRLIFPSWMARSGSPLITAYNQLTRKRQPYTAFSIQALGNCNPNISNDRATAELSYHPRSLSETLLDTLRWYQKVGMLDLNIKLKSLQT